MRPAIVSVVEHKARVEKHDENTGRMSHHICRASQVSQPKRRVVSSRVAPLYGELTLPGEIMAQVTAEY